MFRQGKIDDEVATSFAHGFYKTMCNGKDVPAAYEYGKSYMFSDKQLDQEAFAESALPLLIALKEKAGGPINTRAVSFFAQKSVAAYEKSVNHGINPRENPSIVE